MLQKKDQLITERLVMKNLEEEDKVALLRMATDERLKRTYMFPDFADQAQAEAFYKRLRSLCASDAYFIYGIYLQGRLIGMLNNCKIDGTSIELGYFISAEHWNRGYASEALRAAIDELFRMGYETVTAGYFEENPASGRVMEKCGMRPLPEESVIDYRGVSHRCLYRGIRREEAAAKRAAGTPGSGGANPR